MIENINVDKDKLFNASMAEIGRLENICLNQKAVIQQMQDMITERDKQILQLHNELSIHDQLLTKGDDKIESTKSDTKYRQKTNKPAKSSAKTK